MCSLKTCVGIPDLRFTDLTKGRTNAQLLSVNKVVTAYPDVGFCVLVDGQTYMSTVRCSRCHLLCSGHSCIQCTAYRSTLIAMSFRLEKSDNTVQKKTTIFR